MLSSPSHHRRQHSDGTTASQKLHQQRRSTTYLAIVGILVLFDFFFHGGVFPIASSSSSSSSDETVSRFSFMLSKSYNRPHVYPFERRIAKKVTTNSSNDEKSPMCVPQPNQPLSKLDYQIETKSSPSSANKRTDIKFVFCRFLNLNNHLPHAMQQIYRCYSLWRDYPEARPILMLPNKAVVKELYYHQFIAGMLTLFHEQMNVSSVMEDELQPTDLEHYQTEPTAIFESFQGKDYNIRHTKFLHQIVGKHLNLTDNDSSRMTCQHAKPRIGILNRMDHYRRSIENVEELANAIAGFSRKESVPVKYFEQTYFKEQVRFFRSVDILISPHGAQLTGVAFMNAPCSHVLELFPKKYHLPRFFGSLAMESEKDYSHIYLSGNSSRLDGSTKNRQEREQARATNLCPSIPMMKETVRELTNQWRQCCEARRG